MPGFARKFFATREQVEADYAVLGSADAVARKHGVSKKLILRYMDRWGLSRRVPVPIDAVRQMAEQGKTSKEIGLYFHVSTVRICKIARDNGFTIVDPYHSGVLWHNGYRLIRVKDHPFANRHGYVPEHRLVAEKTLGRYLRRDEVAHHDNRDKSDNRPENIVVMTLSEHKSLHRKAKDCGRHKLTY